MACVFPGVWLTRATVFRFRTALMRLDFPTLLRPTIANCGRLSVGKSSALYAARENSTDRISNCDLSCFGDAKRVCLRRRNLKCRESNGVDCADILRDVNGGDGSPMTRDRLLPVTRDLSPESVRHRPFDHLCWFRSRLRR